MTEPTDRVPPPGDAAQQTDDEYSATVLASHWIQRPEPDTTATVLLQAAETLPVRDSGQPASPEARSGPAGTTVVRFGPGVRAALARRAYATPPEVLTPVTAPQRRPVRRHTLPLLALLVVLAVVVWQRVGPPLAVDRMTVTSSATALGCDSTADVVGVVTTNGRPGTVSYRWVRSDGTASEVLHEVMARGQKTARLHLRWTFQGEGRYEARAELRVLSPTPHTAVTDLTYSCP